MNNVNYYRDDKLPIFEIKSCDSGIHSSKDHYHDELSIGIIEKGSSTVNCNGKSYNISSKTAIVIYPDAVHRCNPKNVDDWKFSMIYLKKEWFESTFNITLKTKGLVVKELTSKDINRMKSLFIFLQNNKPSIEKETRLIMDIEYLLEIDNHILKDFRQLYINEKVIEIVKDYIDNNFLDKITLDDLAKHGSLSKYHLLRTFKELLGTTPHLYQILLRLNYSKKLLKNTDNISYIAQETGFYDQSHFSKSFKECFGVNPSDYKVM